MTNVVGATIASKTSIVSQGILETSVPRSAFMFPEVTVGGNPSADDEIFVLQYWPESLEDSYNVEWAQKQTPGGSHPLLQWVGGSGRDISFQAVFTSEVDQGFDTRLNTFRGGLPNPVATALTPSARYTVDIRGAVNRVRSYMLPEYGGKTSGPNINSIAAAPKKLYLVMQGSRMGGNKDYILCVLRSAPITYEAWFPNGTPRIVVVSLTFSEIVQTRGGDGSSSIQFIGRSSFEQDAKNYRFRGTVDKAVGG